MKIRLREPEGFAYLCEMGKKRLKVSEIVIDIKRKSPQETLQRAFLGQLQHQMFGCGVVRR